MSVRYAYARHHQRGADSAGAPASGIARHPQSTPVSELPDDLSDRAALDRHLEVNVSGTYHVTKTFLALLERSRGTIVNIVSVGAPAALPIPPPVRRFKGGGVLAFAITTRPCRGTRRDHAHRSVRPCRHRHRTRRPSERIERGDGEIFPDPLSATLAEAGALKALERQVPHVGAERGGAMKNVPDGSQCVRNATMSTVFANVR